MAAFGVGWLTGSGGHRGRMATPSGGQGFGSDCHADRVAGRRSRHEPPSEPGLGTARRTAGRSVALARRVARWTEVLPDGPFRLSCQSAWRCRSSLNAPLVRPALGIRAAPFRPCASVRRGAHVRGGRRGSSSAAGLGAREPRAPNRSGGRRGDWFSGRRRGRCGRATEMRARRPENAAVIVDNWRRSESATAELSVGWAKLDSGEAPWVGGPPAGLGVRSGHAAPCGRTARLWAGREVAFGRSAELTGCVRDTTVTYAGMRLLRCGSVRRRKDCPPVRSRRGVTAETRCFPSLACCRACFTPDSRPEVGTASAVPDRRAAIVRPAWRPRTNG